MNIKITPSKLSGTIDAIPSKSHAHRVLIAQKLAQLGGDTKKNPLKIPSFSQDIEATKNCLVQLDKTRPYLDCKESGSTLRFMLPVAMALKDEAVFIGAGKLPERPISPLKEEMESHGCTFVMGNARRSVDEKYREICTIRGRLQPGTFRLAGNISSQFITGLLFALPVLPGDSRLELTTALESAGYVDMTLDVLKSFGIVIKQSLSEDGFIVYDIKGCQKYREPDDLRIEGDWSNAAFWLACGALGGNITCRGLNPLSTQRDRQMARILEVMGAKVKQNKDTISCKGRALTATDVDVTQIPDLVPVMSVVMAVAGGSSMITNAQRLRIKESDRLATVCDMLSRLGADVSDGGSCLSVSGRPYLYGGIIDGHNDHRIVMAAAVASCVCRQPIIIKGAEAVRKSYPGFFKDFSSLGGIVEEEYIK